MCWCARFFNKLKPISCWIVKFITIKAFTFLTGAKIESQLFSPQWFLQPSLCIGKLLNAQCAKDFPQHIVHIYFVQIHTEKCWSIEHWTCARALHELSASWLPTKRFSAHVKSRKSAMWRSRRDLHSINILSLTITNGDSPSSAAASSVHILSTQISPSNGQLVLV